MLILSLPFSFYLYILVIFLKLFVFRTNFEKVSFVVCIFLSVLIESIIFGAALRGSNLFFVSYMVELKAVILSGFGAIPNIHFISIYLLFIAALYHFLPEIDQKLGRGNLWKFRRWCLYKLKTENHIFMFLNIRDSTTSTEQVGHLRFSRSVQDCFNNFWVIDPYYARVYPHVEYEVAISWSVERDCQGLKGESGKVNLFNAELI